MNYGAIMYGGITYGYYKCMGVLCMGIFVKYSILSSDFNEN